MIQEIYNFISLLGLFFALWVLAAIGHECFHGLACLIQGCDFKIKIWFHELRKGIKIPSMMCIPEGILKDTDLFYYLGGVGLGCTFTLLSLPFYFIYMPLFITLFLIGMTHFFYGIYEGLFIRKLELKEYMLYHYILYGIVLGIGMLLIRKEILDCIVASSSVNMVIG